MIEYLKGQVIHRRATGLVISVNGVGYGVELPLSNLCQIQIDSKEIELWIYTHVREDAFRLFGFLTPNERELFEIILSVNGIGPKLALAILSTLDITAIKQAVVRELPDVFEAVPGIGKRMAEKILVEMKAKLKRLNSMSSAQDGAGSGVIVGMLDQDILGDVQSALENLGFKSPLVTLTLKNLLQGRTSNIDFNSLLKDALVKLGGSDSKSVAQGASSASDSAKFF